MVIQDGLREMNSLSYEINLAKQLVKVTVWTNKYFYCIQWLIKYDTYSFKWDLFHVGIIN